MTWIVSSRAVLVLLPLQQVPSGLWLGSPQRGARQMAEDLAAGLQLGPSSSFAAGPGSRSRSSLEGRKRFSGVYRPPRPSSLPSAEPSLIGRPSLPGSDSRASLGSLGAASQHASASQNYHSRFQKVGQAGGAPTQAAQPRQQLDRHPYAHIPGMPTSKQPNLSTRCCCRVTPATSPDEGADRVGDAGLDLTDAERRQAKRDDLRGEHEKSQLQLMRLLDQIREVRMTRVRHPGLQPFDEQFRFCRTRLQTSFTI